MQIKILDGVEVRSDRGIIDLQRGLMTAAVFVLVQAERPLTRDELKELLWESEDTGDRSVVALISRLKERLGDRVTSDGISYGLMLTDKDYVDLRVFNALCDQAERVSGPDPWQAVLLYDHALRLWAEPLLTGLPSTIALEKVRRSLIDAYLDAYERKLELELLVGRHKELARSQQLRRFVDAYPHAEHLRRALMLAKYRASRPGEARQLYEELHDELRTKYDAAPAPVLQRLYEQIRVSDPSLLWQEPVPHPADRAVIECGGDPTRPSTVRMEDVLIGGGFNTARDRAAAAILSAVAPQVPELQVQNERFGARVARHLAREKGIVRVLEVGASIPGPYSAHVQMRRIAQDTHVVYTQPDASAVKYSAKVLEPVEQVEYLLATLRDPRTILEHPAVEELLKPGEPVLLMMRQAINYITDEEDPRALLQAIVDELPHGSHVALNIATDEGMTDLVAQQLVAIYADSYDETLVLRDRRAAEAMFDGLELLPPGVTYIQEVLQDRPCQVKLGPFRAFGGVAVKR